jgi:sialic acid synthase SpsE
MNACKVKIGSKSIGRDHPCFLIAEVGTTCLGNLDNALSLVDVAARAGMDALKFQLIDPDQLSDTGAQYPIVINGMRKMVSMKEMFVELEFSDAEWRSIRDACHQAGLEFFATVDHLSGVERLEQLGVSVHKMGAWDANYRPLFEKIARTGKPMFMDLGPATEDEVRQMVNWFRQAGGQTMLFMHDFHTQDDRQMNMRAIEYLVEMYPEWPVGFSSPGIDDSLDIVALSLGATFIEKRLILSRNLEAFHAHESLEPYELVAWGERMRHVERALGTKSIRPSDADRANSIEYYRSICTLSTVHKGEKFSAKNLDAKRPGTGMCPSKLSDIWGKTASREIEPNTLISEGDFI